VADTQESNGPGRFVQHDVASEESWKTLLADVLAREGRLDIMVNNAGVAGGRATSRRLRSRTGRRSMPSTPTASSSLQVCHRGHEADRPGQTRSKGSIVNVSSVAALIGSAGPTAYTASKGAVRLLSKSVALYCAEKKYGIRCNSVHPGGVDTAIFNPLWQMVGREQGKAMIGAAHPVGHMGEPNDLGEVVLWLASDRSSFVTGAEIVADGGLTTGLMRRTAFAAP